MQGYPVDFEFQGCGINGLSFCAVRVRSQDFRGNPITAQLHAVIGKVVAVQRHLSAFYRAQADRHIRMHTRRSSPRWLVVKIVPELLCRKELGAGKNSLGSSGHSVGIVRHLSIFRDQSLLLAALLMRASSAQSI